MTILDEIEGVSARTRSVVLVVGIIFLTLGVVKVKNELKMTKAYDRQAVAHERIADYGERSEKREALVSPDNGWRRTERIYTYAGPIPCHELTYSKAGFESVVSHFCGKIGRFNHPGVDGTRLGHSYSLTEAQ